MATILLVEDDTSMRLLTTAKLKHRYAIISVQDGVEALDVLERHPVDLIIADVMMPRMDGYTGKTAGAGGPGSRCSCSPPNSLSRTSVRDFLRRGRLYDQAGELRGR